jgi:RimJ/RimL family protein N-acetyltransferase
MFLIETKRLKLRELNESDEKFLCDILSDRETMQYYPAPYDIDAVRNSIKRTINSYQKNNFGLWGIILKDQKKFIGQCGITLQDIDGIIVPEIGYHVNKEYWNQDFATEASAASLKYGFEKLNLNEIYIHTYIKNIPSQRVAEKLKMKRIKEYEKYIKEYNIYMKHVVYSMNLEHYNQVKITLARYSVII